ncbi:sensor histidine kinase [Parashewanella curva]|uniref:histidine kinase n=1 Tax=Parashewanella curva TaxID=2338552 RepID=A0A3L8PZ09_9GAMM|nr:HAMP domain-containing sensor histidine kinase [Parashewanella curva]RLV59758.1 sensor histidine kinase [Parashewanella curva]
MSINQKSIKKLDFIPKILSILSVVFLIVSLVFTVLSYRSFKSLLDANENRYQSYLLTEQLRLSSDQLTLMAGAYAVTKNPRFLKYFEQIMKIRDGESPRPNNYERVYWDFLMPEHSMPPFELGSRKSLHQLMIESGIESAELLQLDKAKAESDNLAQLELQAFELTQNSSLDDLSAVKILYSEAYFHTKVKIMSYINEFYQLQDERTAAHISALNTYHNRTVTLAIFGFAGLVICLFLILYFRLKSSSKLLGMLQTEVDKQTIELNDKNDELNCNIEQIKLAQDQLVESEKMASLGNLVAGVAHEVNTPLSTSMALASHLEQEIEVLNKGVENGTLKRTQLESFLASSTENCRLLLSNNERAAQLIASFKKIAVEQSSEALREFTVDIYLTDTIRSLHHKFKPTSITIDTQISQSGLVIKSYPGAFSQVISNLLMNALMHAYDDGNKHGRITINVSMQNQQLVLMFADDGVGMNQQQQAKIFEPFFTTKRGQGGSGLGMSIVYNLVTHKMNGQIRCKSSLNQGTQFTILLPLVIDNV